MNETEKNWEEFGEWVSEREYTEREGYEHAMNEYYENFVEVRQDSGEQSELLTKHERERHV